MVVAWAHTRVPGFFLNVHPDPYSALVDYVNGLIRKPALVDVERGETNRLAEGIVIVFHVMEALVLGT